MPPWGEGPTFSGSHPPTVPRDWSPPRTHLWGVSSCPGAPHGVNIVPRGVVGDTVPRGALRGTLCVSPHGGRVVGGTWGLGA